MNSSAHSFPSDGEPRPAPPPSAWPSVSPLACPWCGQLHTRVPLRRGDTLKCVRCGHVLATGRASNWIVTFAWVLTGLILWVPANFLPLVAVSQLGNSHESLLLTGAGQLWRQGMPWIGALVLLCGILAPLLLLLSLATVLAPIVCHRPTSRVRFVLRWLHHFELWSIPEVYLLGVLVAFIKLGSLVRAEPSAGLACYSLMALALLIAWRRFDIDAAAEALARGKLKGPVT